VLVEGLKLNVNITKGRQEKARKEIVEKPLPVRK
jgi:hypothetical protein